MCVCVCTHLTFLYTGVNFWALPRTFLGTGKSYRNFKSQAQFQFDTALSQESDFTFTFHFHALEKEMATHSSVLAWRIPGMVEPGGLPSTGSHRVRHDWSDLAAAAASQEKIFNLIYQWVFSPSSSWDLLSTICSERGVVLLLLFPVWHFSLFLRVLRFLDLPVQRQGIEREVIWMESSFLADAAVRFPHLSGPGSCLELYLPLMVFHSLKPLAPAQVLLSNPRPATVL